MKRAQLPALALVLLVASGCGYLNRRGRDAMDIFTLGVVAGGGAAADVGPLSAGLCYFNDIAGLRGGRVGLNNPGHLANGQQIHFFLIGFESMASMDGVMERGKYFTAAKLPIGLPETAFSQQEPPPFAPYWTRIEVVAGLWFGVRAGVNPGELADFLVGWFGLDLYADDRLDEAELEAEAEKHLTPGQKKSKPVPFTDDPFGM